MLRKKMKIKGAYVIWQEEPRFILKCHLIKKKNPSMKITSFQLQSEFSI